MSYQQLRDSNTVGKLITICLHKEVLTFFSAGYYPPNLGDILQKFAFFLCGAHNQREERKSQESDGFLCFPISTLPSISALVLPWRAIIRGLPSLQWPSWAGQEETRSCPWTSALFLWGVIQFSRGCRYCCHHKAKWGVDITPSACILSALSTCKCPCFSRNVKKPHICDFL